MKFNSKNAVVWLGLVLIAISFIGIFALSREDKAEPSFHRSTNIKGMATTKPTSTVFEEDKKPS